MTIAGDVAVDRALDDVLGSLAGPLPACRHRRAALVRLLGEDDSVYAGRATSEAERLRAFLMVRLAELGLAEQCLPYIVEELETGMTAYGLGAAGRALRFVDWRLGLVDRIDSAIARCLPVNEFVDFSRFPATGGGDATAVDELTAARAHLEHALPPGIAPASCCGGGEPHSDIEEALPDALITVPPVVLVDLGATMLENQDGARETLADLIAGRSTVIGFFYTRCMNPRKCSSTIGKLAQVHAILNRSAARPFLVAAVSYDPAFDSPARLHTYGRDRGLSFSSSCQLLRTVGDFAPLASALDLAVGYGSATVNRHGIDLLMIGSDGGQIKRWNRGLWDPQAVADTVLALG